MKYLIFSDSHRNTAPMDEVIQKEECDAVLHLGDVADDVEHLRRKFFYKTICAVSGNNDVFFREDPTEVFLEDCGHRIATGTVSRSKRERTGSCTQQKRTAATLHFSGTHIQPATKRLTAYCSSIPVQSGETEHTPS